MLAGAGTGKTRAITHRIAYGVATGVYEPTEVLAVTFTTRAAGEMRTRLRKLGAPGVQARTFHSAALRQLRYFWPHVHGTDLPALTESKIGLLATAARRSRIQTDQALLRDLASEIEWAKVSNVHPDDYARLAARRGRSVAGHDHETVARVFSTYEDVKRSQGRMDMEDVLLFTAGMLADDERVAAQVRRQYKRFVVDEFQDVSPIQSALLDLWLGGRDELCVVGDPAQTIYSFAGANASYLRDFPAKFPGTTSIELVRNYRSTPEVVTAANTLLAELVEPGRRAPRPAAVRVPPSPSTPAPTRSPRPRPSPPGSPACATRVARRARSRCCSGSTPSRRPSRTPWPGAPSRTSSAAPRASSTGPRSGRRVTLLRGTARSGQGRRRPASTTVRDTLAGMGWSTEAPAARGQTRDRWESLQALVDQAIEFARADGADLGGFVDDLDRRAAEQHAPVADGVTLATLHAAKGLEWDSVFLVGLQEGTLPFSYAETPAEVEEERRLLYVGMTRARLDLALSWSLARNPGGRASRKPSRFLDGLLPEEKRAPAKLRRAGAWPAAASAASRWPPAPRRSAVAAPAAPRPTTRSCSSACVSGGGHRRGRERAGLRGVHRRHPAADRRAQTDARPRLC